MPSHHGNRHHPRAAAPSDSCSSSSSSSSSDDSSDCGCVRCAPPPARKHHHHHRAHGARASTHHRRQHRDRELPPQLVGPALCTQTDSLLVQSNALTCIHNKIRAAVCDIGLTIEAMTADGWDISGADHKGRAMAKVQPSGAYTNVALAVQSGTPHETLALLARFKHEVTCKVASCPQSLCGIPRVPMVAAPFPPCPPVFGACATPAPMISCATTPFPVPYLAVAHTAFAVPHHTTTCTTTDDHHAGGHHHGGGHTYSAPAAVIPPRY